MLCGVTCLQMICEYFGRKYSMETLSNYCFATIEGISILGLSEGANKLGLHTLCGRTTPELLCQAPLPCILHWNQNHFVVLYKIQKRSNKEYWFYIADPGRDLIRYNGKEFANFQNTNSENNLSSLIEDRQENKQFFNFPDLGLSSA